jgi:hypothetical protein
LAYLSFCLGQQQTTNTHLAKGACWYCSGGIVCFGEIIQTPSIPTITPLDDDERAYTGVYVPRLLPQMPRLSPERLMYSGLFMKMIWPAEVDKGTFLTFAVASAQSWAAGDATHPPTIEEYASGQAALRIAKLRVGMIETEVTRLLGPAWYITGFMSWYKCGPLTVNVSYADGRLEDFDIRGCSDKLFCRRVDLLDAVISRYVTSSQMSKDLGMPR